MKKTGSGSADESSADESSADDKSERSAADNDESRREATPKQSSKSRSRKAGRKRTKKRADETATDESAATHERDADADAARPGPRFTHGYPRHPKLDALIAAYAAGNFGYVRQHAPALADSADTEEVRSAAADLRRRIEPAPLAALLWALGIALLVLLFGYYLQHTH